MDKGRADFEAATAKLSMNSDGKDVPQVWFTRKEVMALLGECAKASRKQALEEAAGAVDRLLIDALIEPTVYGIGIRDSVAAIRSLEGNAKETT